MSYAYTLHLGPQEVDALHYISGRYESGRVLYHGLEIASTAEEARFEAGHRVAWKLPEHVAWEYQSALEEEGGIIPPLAGGHLASELLKLYNAIV